MSNYNYNPFTPQTPQQGPSGGLGGALPYIDDAILLANLFGGKLTKRFGINNPLQGARALNALTQKGTTAGIDAGKFIENLNKLGQNPYTTATDEAGNVIKTPLNFKSNPLFKQTGFKGFTVNPSGEAVANPVYGANEDYIKSILNPQTKTGFKGMFSKGTVGAAEATTKTGLSDLGMLGNTAEANALRGAATEAATKAGVFRTLGSLTRGRGLGLAIAASPFLLNAARNIPGTIAGIENIPRSFIGGWEALTNKPSAAELASLTQSINPKQNIINTYDSLINASNYNTANALGALQKSAADIALTDKNIMNSGIGGSSFGPAINPSAATSAIVNAGKANVDALKNAAVNSGVQTGASGMGLAPSQMQGYANNIGTLAGQNQQSAAANVSDIGAANSNYARNAMANQAANVDLFNSAAQLQAINYNKQLAHEKAMALQSLRGQPTPMLTQATLYPLLSQYYSTPGLRGQMSFEEFARNQLGGQTAGMYNAYNSATPNVANPNVTPNIGY